VRAVTRFNLSAQTLREHGVPEEEIAEIVRAGVYLPGGAASEERDGKYNARSCYDDRFGTGAWFQSEWEREVWYGRMLQERAGEIRNLRRQVPYPLEVNGILITIYKADHVFEERVKGEVEMGGEVVEVLKWVQVVEDAKGILTKEYLLKRKLMLACYGITIRETRKQAR
jgi:hypothetical protein